jgi:hypothetical protein
MPPPESRVSVAIVGEDRWSAVFARFRQDAQRTSGAVRSAGGLFDLGPAAGALRTLDRQHDAFARRAAERIGITKQAVSQRARPAGWSLERDVRPVLEGLLTRCAGSAS